MAEEEVKTKKKNLFGSRSKDKDKDKKQKKEKTKNQIPTEKENNSSESENEDKPPQDTTKKELRKTTSVSASQPPAYQPPTLSTVTSTPTSSDLSSYPTLCVFWLQEVKIGGLSKGDVVYFEWRVEGKTETSPSIKVKDTKKIRWPKISKFSVNTTIIGNLGKGKESFEEKFLIINFCKAEKKRNCRNHRRDSKNRYSRFSCDA